jgi:outer membrane cobalamin receptor
MAQVDTVQSLEQVEVSSQRAPSTLRTAVPTQVVDAEKIESRGLLQLSDAVRQMAGVTLKDYGGIGGIKTVSARGLGSQFSTLTIDGVAVDDAQNGQVDLGRYLLTGAAYVSLSHGQQQETLLSARAYAAGNVLNLESAEPRFFMAERTNLKVGMELGSFEMMNPSVQWEQRWSGRLKSSLLVSWLQSDGDYPFTLYYTASRDDSSSLERREHSAMHMLTADGSLYYTIGKGNSLTAKVHYMRGHHQLPGPVIFYTQRPSRQGTDEEVAFAQAKWKKEQGKWKVQVLGKVQQTYDRFEDSAAYTITGFQMNDYLQREAYISGSAVWNAMSWLDLSGATDGSFSSLVTNLAQRNDVHRLNLMSVVAARVHNKGLEVRGNLLLTAVADRVADLDTMPAYRRLSPYVGAMYTFGEGWLTLRYFYKETYRAPNFSELYFFTMPRDLRPECAKQHNIGATVATEWMGATVDAYYNRVRDKILAIPTQNMFLWSMQNIGKVDILGFDATANIQKSTFNIQLNYSYQRAIDRTDPDGKTYGHQIAYTPRHSGGGNVRWENKWVNLGTTAMVVGERFYRMQNSDETRLPAYFDLGLQADHAFDLRWGTLRVQVQVLNLLDVQYEVVRSYPMMGRNYRLKMVYEF